MDFFSTAPVFSLSMLTFLRALYKTGSIVRRTVLGVMTDVYSSLCLVVMFLCAQKQNISYVGPRIWTFLKTD